MFIEKFLNFYLIILQITGKRWLKMSYYIKNSIFRIILRGEEKYDIWLSLHQIYDMFEKLHLFPGKLEKSTIRYFFEYSRSDDIGLDYEDFTLFLPMLGLHTIDTAKRLAENTNDNKKGDLIKGSINNEDISDEPLQMVN